MMSLQQIDDMGREAAQEAAQENREPFILWEEDLASIPPFPFPFLGDYCPDGWQAVQLEEQHGVYLGDNSPYGAYFVDACGLGAPGEAALTIDQFVELLESGYGYAVIESGQFQVKVAKYKRVDN